MAGVPAAHQRYHRLISDAIAVLYPAGERDEKEQAMALVGLSATFIEKEIKNLPDVRDLREKIVVDFKNLAALAMRRNMDETIVEIYRLMKEYKEIENL